VPTTPNDDRLTSAAACYAAIRSVLRISVLLLVGTSVPERA